MNCATHTEAPATAYCRSCGRAVCDECKRAAQGTIFCAEHEPPPGAAPAAPPPVLAAAAPGSPSAALAFVLGIIPGVGAIYNGQYAKGLVHALLTGVLISAINASPGSVQPILGVIMAAWFFYMPIEAYHTAKKRVSGERVDEFSSLIDLSSQKGGFPVGAIALIVLGVLFLLETTDIIHFDRIVRYWPVLLIAGGVYQLMSRRQGGNGEQSQ